MPFRRSLSIPEPVKFGALTARMVGIGMNFAATPEPDPNIEDTLMLASIEAMEKHDLRVLAMLVTWFGVHAAWVNADRLTHLAAAQNSPRVRALWSALAGWQHKDRRFARLSKLYVGRRQEVIESGTEFQIHRYGEDVRFEGTPIRVAANILRDRRNDVLAPKDLARTHRAYRHRVMMGPSYRADMWALLEADPTLSAAALARRAHGSFSTAWHVRRDFELLANVGGPTIGGHGKKPVKSVGKSSRGTT
jgi:hypothetical protein